MDGVRRERLVLRAYGEGMPDAGGQSQRERSAAPCASTGSVRQAGASFSRSEKDISDCDPRAREHVLFESNERARRVTLAHFRGMDDRVPFTRDSLERVSWCLRSS